MTVPNEDPEPDDELEASPAGTPPADDESGNQDADGSGTPPAEGDEPPQPGTKAWADLEKKYPGMSEEQLREHVAERYWDQTRALSKSEKAYRALELEVARLKGRVEATQPGTPPKEEEPPAPPPEVAELDATINDLKQRDERLAQAQLDTLKSLNEATAKTNELKGKLEAAKEAGDQDKAEKIEARLDAAQAKEDQLRDRLDASVERRRDLARQHRDAVRDRNWYEKLAKEARSREESELADQQEQLEEIPVIVDGLIAEAIKDLPADPALREHVTDVLRSKTTVDLWRAGQRHIPFAKLDLPGMLKQHVDAYAKANNIARRDTFRKKSEEATRTATPPGQPRPAAPPQPGNSTKKPAVSPVGALSAGMARGRRFLAGRGW